MLKYLKAYIILFSKHELLLININQLHQLVPFYVCLK